jgi:transglutaminase-like putative cysteine protease
MSWRLQVNHTTRYRYDSPVMQSYNEARLEPRSDRHQTVLSSRVEVEPATRVVRHVDYWGTVVHHFDVQVPHDELTVVGRTTVETATAPPEPADATWDDLDSAEVTDRFAELLTPTPMVSWDDRITDVAGELRAAHPTPIEAAEAAVGWVNRHIEYSPGSTGVRTTATEVLDARAGVCQDFAHLSLALLRAMRIPAWYVSGYLHHAWVAVFAGSLRPLDPTSLDPVAERHVRVAAGRDYADVAPFKGIYSGHSGQELSVSVEITRKA